MKFKKKRILSDILLTILSEREWEGKNGFQNKIQFSFLFSIRISLSFFVVNDGNIKFKFHRFQSISFRFSKHQTKIRESECKKSQLIILIVKSDKKKSKK